MDNADDEFGDLYADVLLPAAAPPSPSLNTASASASTSTSTSTSTVTSRPRPPHPIPSPRFNSDVEYGVPASCNLPSTPPPRLPSPSVVPGSLGGGDDDWILARARVSAEHPAGWDEGDDEGLPRVSRSEAADLVPQPGICWVLMDEEEGVVAGSTEKPKKQVKEEDRIVAAEDGGDSVPEEDAKSLGIGPGVTDLDQEPLIPGLSVTSLSADGKVSRSNEWIRDSDSEDDLQIVLNDDSLERMGGDGEGVRVVDGDDEDEIDDLVIVTDEGHHLHHHQGVREQDMDRESMQQALDSEGKVKSEAVKVNGGIGTVSLAKSGCNNSHGYHGQDHSQFKCVRPGVSAIPGGAAAITGAASSQLRPPITIGPMAGRGRGAQKGFHSGYGALVWSNSTSARAYGVGLEYTLPSYKTIFDIDMDEFEEKPWRLPGVDVSDFFNFGFNEDMWRDFCKHLIQLRVVATMQSKIHVHESGRSEQDYDPDLPPELAAATGLQHISVERTHGKTDNRQPDLINHGRGAPSLQPQPIGRAIQVESGIGERLPSIDTRPPRIRDSDAVIEIVLQDSVDACRAASDQQIYEHQGQIKDDHKDEDENKRADSEYFNHFLPACNGRTKEFMRRKVSPMGSVDDDTHERDGILSFPLDTSSKSLSDPKSQIPLLAGDQYDTPHVARQTQSNTGVECSNDPVSGHSLKFRTSNDPGERSGNSEENKGVLQISPIVSQETAVEVNLEQRSDEYAVAADDGTEIEEEETPPDLRLSDECHGGAVLHHAIKKQKLSSQVELVGLQGKDDGDDSRTTHSDNSRVRSRHGKDYLSRHEVGEGEVIKSGRSGQSGDQKGRHHEGERRLKQRDEHGQDGRHDMNRSRITSNGREDVYHSCLHRDRNSTNHRCRSEGFESGKERDDSVGGCLREDAAYCRRGKDEEREQYHDDEIGLRHRSRDKVSGRKGKDEDLHSRKHIGNGDRKGHDRDDMPRQRVRDASSMSRHENRDGLHVKRRKYEQRPVREKMEKGDGLHGRKDREGTNHSKRGRDNGANHNKREEQTRLRANSHFTKHRDDNLRRKERDNRQLNKFNEVTHQHKERETMHAIVNGGRVLEDKPMVGVEKVNGSSKNLGDKNRRKHIEQQKGGDHIEEGSHEQHEAWKEACTHENQLTNGGKISRNQGFSSRINHPLAASDSQQMSREKHRENTSKEVKGGETSFMATRKRKHEDQGHILNCKVGAKVINEKGGNTCSILLSKNGQHPMNKPPGIQEQCYFLGNHAEEDSASDDDGTSNVRKGRSKLERWTSHQERDYSNGSLQPLSSSSRVRKLEVGNADIVKLGDPNKTEGNSNVDSSAKEAETVQIDHAGDEN